MKRTAFHMSVLALVLFAAGCRGRAPIVNLNDQSIPNTRSLSLDEMTRAIISAGAQLGWDMKPVSPGKIAGTLNIREHTAKIDITYSAASYNITYVDSVNLKYDSAENSIHPNYNGWIQRLDQTIKSKLAAL